MAMGERQQDLFIATDQLPKSDGHVFYRRLNSLLADSQFDDFVEELCRGYYKEDGPGRPSIPPGVYFRMLIVGYFEGIDSHRGIAWRCNDSLSLRDFLGTPLSESTPDHSTLSRTRGQLPLEVHERMFQFILKIAADKRLLSAKTVGVDSTMLEANAAMKSIVREDAGEDYRQYLLKLALETGIENPIDEELRRFDKNRKDKTCSNDDWQSPSDPAAKIAKMKDGRTHLAYKAEHVVDLESEFILAATVCPATWGDAETLIDSVNTAQHNVDLAAAMNEKPPAKVTDDDCKRTTATITEVAADKGYHKASTLELAEAMDLRTYIIPKPAPASRPPPPSSCRPSTACAATAFSTAPATSSASSTTRSRPPPLTSPSSSAFRKPPTDSPIEMPTKAAAEIQRQLCGTWVKWVNALASTLR